MFLELAADTVHQAAQAGANMIVAGSAIFKSPSPRTVMNQLRESVEKHMEENSANSLKA